VKSERNYFENSSNAVLSSGSTQVGLAEVISNKLVNSTTTTIGTCTAALGYNYSSVLTSDANNVKSIVIQYAGVGKLITGIEDNKEEKEQAVAFPNPFTNRMMMKQQGAFQYQIFNLEGQEMENGEGQDFTEIGEQLARGCYLLRIQSEGHSHTTKIYKVQR